MRAEEEGGIRPSGDGGWVGSKSGHQSQSRLPHPDPHSAPDGPTTCTLIEASLRRRRKAASNHLAAAFPNSGAVEQLGISAAPALNPQ